MRSLLLALTFMLVGQASATGEINVLTDLKSPFPPGCVAVSLPQGPAQGGDELFDETIAVPSVNENQPAAQVRIRIWRTGCHDEGYSVVMVRLRKVGDSGGRVLVPRVFAEAGEVNVPDHMAQLIRHPAVGNVGASGNEIGEQGITYMLGVDPFSIDGQTEFWPEHYNDLFTLEMYWGDYSGSDESHYVLFSIPEYVPESDPPQNAFPTLHGRMSGQYTVDGLPYSGVVLQVGEVYNQGEPDTNSVSVLFFTYLNGDPFWVVGSKVLDPGFDIVELDMLELAGGEFITSPPGSYDEDDVSTDSIGTMTLEAIDCNRLLITYDFDEGGLGSGQFEADRLVNLAGYTCNPWR